jgi:hypothetical protein
MLLVGALLWNGWVFGFFNHGLAGYLHMSISELEVAGQQHTALFNFLEDASGTCIVIGTLGLIAIANRRINIMTIILISTTTIGALTLYDVAHPLDCNRYNNPVCVARVNANKVSRRDVLHNNESRITCYLTLLLAILIAVWAFVEKLQRSELIGLMVLAAGIAITLAILDTNGNILTDAVSERIWNVLVSIDIGYVSWKFMKLKHSKRPIATPV